jgi:DNA polymerase-3 subunit epsilon
VISLRRGSRAWRDAAFAVLDFEATGLDLVRDRVLSYGVVPVETGRITMKGALYRVVRPPVPLPPESIRVHGIRPDELADAPPLEDVLDELMEAIGDRALVAHAAGVELGFLRQLRERHGVRAIRRAIDVLDLSDELTARDRSAPDVTTRRLAALAESYGVPVAPTHHAFGDALTTAQLFLVLATRLERLGAGRVRDLERAGRSQFARSFAARTP